MATEVINIKGADTGEYYGGLYLPEADDIQTAYALNDIIDIVKAGSKWAKAQEKLEFVAKTYEPIERMEFDTLF